MATCSLPLPPNVKLKWPHQAASSSSSSSLICRRSSLPLSNFKHRTWPGLCHASSPVPPSPPPESGTNSKKSRAPSSGVTANLARLQDTVQIFFAVLFWMSLFFWSSAWDGKSIGRQNKGPRSRK